jgi:CubicO group peptidase (beta-lactamase class C family)
MQREVFAPLAMTRTALERTDDDPDVVSAYFPRMAMRPSLGLQTAPAAEYSCFAGAGAYLSTPSDLVRLGSAMVKPGLLKAETIAVMQEPLRLASGASTGFALGWRAENLPLAGAQTRVLRHRGSPSGGMSSLTLLPDRKLVIAATANVSYASGLDPFTLQVADAFMKAR